MTVFDYIVLTIVGASLFLGLWRGVVGEILAMLAWVLALAASIYFAPVLSDTLFSSILDPAMRLISAYTAVFLGILIIMGLVRMAVRRMIRAIGLSVSDRFLGLLFGLARGFFIILTLVALGGMTHLPQQDWWAKAQLSPPMETAVLALLPWLPEEIAKRIKFR